MILLSIGLIVFLSNGCAGKLELPNQEVCRDKGVLGARCNFTNEGDPYSLNKLDWDQRRFGQFCMSEENYAANQKFMEDACEMTKGCDIVKLKKNIQKVRKRLKAL